MKIRIIRKKTNSIRKKANKLVKGGQVRVNGHRVRLKQNGVFYYCFLCPMDTKCKFNSEMIFVCHECDKITGKKCYLEPVL